jgi:hypothetical protein
VVFSSENVQSALGYEIIVAFTHLGNLRNALCRLLLLPESAGDRLWIGSPALLRSAGPL